MDPLVSISTFNNRTFLNEDILTMDFQQASGKFFVDTSSSTLLRDTEIFNQFRERSSVITLNKEDGKTEQEYKDY